MSLTQTAWKWHRWLAYVVGLQLLLWVTSGIVFAWLPFKPWVKSEPDFRRPALALTAAAAPPPALAAVAADIRSLALVPTANGPAWRAHLAGAAPGPRWWPLDGGEWVPPDAQAVAAFARGLYRGAGALGQVDTLDHVPNRLGIVQETGGRGAVWRVGFDDALGTRLYIDVAGGEFVAIRNEAWVWYDFLWRLHIMDYEGGEDFNNWLLRAAATLAWLMALAGAVLTLMALRRAWRRRR